MTKEFKKAVKELVGVIEKNNAGDEPVLGWESFQAYARIRRSKEFSKKLDDVKALLK